METTKSFETAGGHKVKVIGKLIETENNEITYKTDVVIEGFGSQGSIIARANFSKNGIDYVAIVGKLPLTQDQLDVIDSITKELMTARDNHPLMIDKTQYGTYDEVEINHPWMKNTY